jgi:nucleoside-diphosphate-sugar epimerase
MVLPRLVGQALRGAPLTVFGDGRQRRCFCHVDDTVRALLALLAEPRSAGLVVNVGAAEEVTINRLATLVRRAAGVRAPVVHVPYEEAFGVWVVDPRRRVPETSRLRSLTGWRPRRTLADAVADVVAHERLRLAAGRERRA